MTIKLSKRLTGAACLLVFAYFLLDGVKDPSSLSYFMPLLYGYLLLAAAGCLVVQFFVLRKKDEKDILVLDFNGFLKSDTCKVLAYLLMILAYYVLVSVIGFVVSTVLFLMLSYVFLGVKNARVYITSLVIFAALYSLFSFALNVRFPHGFLY